MHSALRAIRVVCLACSAVVKVRLRMHGCIGCAWYCPAQLACIAQLMVLSSLFPGIMGGGRPRTRASRRLPPCHTLDLLPPPLLPGCGAPAAAAAASAAAAAAAAASTGAAAGPAAADAHLSGGAAAASAASAAPGVPGMPGTTPAAASSSSARCSGPMSASAMTWWPESAGCTHLNGP